MSDKDNSIPASITYHPPEIDHDLYVDVFTSIPKSLQGLIEKKKRILLVYDGHLPQTIIDTTLNLLPKSKCEIELFKIEYGKKDLKRIQKIWSKMLTFHPDLAVALGGGVICDLVAFSSSCYHRGLDHVFFPTTLLSAVDASIGGKTGIDYEGVKNSVGSIHYAKHVYICLPFLESVNTRELFSGLAESIKAGMLFDYKVIKWLQQLDVHAFVANQTWANIIYRSAKLKAAFAEQPMSQRSKLLYGHNIGQAIETYSAKHVRHGDAVSMGMHLEGALGMMLDIMPKNVWLEQLNLIKSFNLPYHLPKNIEKHQLINKMKKYKLYKDGSFLFVIPRRPGQIFENEHDFFVKVSEQEFSHKFDKLINIANSV